MTMPIWAWILLGCLLLGQSLWIYQDAARRGERKLFWGLFGLINVPSSLLVYLLVTRAVLKTKTCPACAKRMELGARYCPQCGKEQQTAQPHAP